MADAEYRAILLVAVGGAYFFLILPVLWFRLQRVLRGAALGVFLGGVGVWFLAHLLLALGSEGVGGLLVLSAAAIGAAILGLARQLMAEPGDAPPP